MGHGMRKSRIQIPNAGPGAGLPWPGSVRLAKATAKRKGEEKKQEVQERGAVEGPAEAVGGKLMWV